MFKILNKKGHWKTRAELTRDDRAKISSPEEVKDFRQFDGNDKYMGLFRHYLDYGDPNGLSKSNPVTTLKQSRKIVLMPTRCQIPL